MERAVEPDGVTLTVPPFGLMVTVEDTAVQLAVNVTLAPLVADKFKYHSAVGLVLVLLHEVVQAVELEPYFAVLVSKLLAVQPANVYPVLVGLLICTADPYVPIVG